jgi:hypothetical protein
MKLVISRAAAIAATFALCAGAAQAQKKNPPPIGALPIETVVEQLDRNGNGCVDLEEGRNYVSRRFHQIDRNGDESLDATEAPPGPDETTNTRPISLVDWQDAYSARFASFDTDGNGCLVKAEVEAGRAKGGQ